MPEAQRTQQLVQQIRIGDLLKEAGIVTSEYIQQALHNFEHRGLPIGKVLVLSGYLTEGQLRIALEIQSLVNDGLLPLDVAAKVLGISHAKSLALADAFQESGFVQPEDQQTNKLGQLLVSAGVVSSRQLDDSLQMNARTGLPLGHIFCFGGAVSPHVVETALLAQNLIRRKLIMRDDAISGINAALRREQQLEQMEMNKGYRRLPQQPSIKLGELLVSSKLLSATQLENALVASLNEQMFLGEVLLRSALVTQDVLNACVELQEMLDNGTLTVDLAPEILIVMKARSVPFYRSVAECGVHRARQNKAVQLVNVLTTSGILDIKLIPRDAQERIDVNYNQAIEVAKILLAANLMDEKTLSSALRCVYLLDNGVLTLQKAIMALDMARRSKQTIDETMYQLGWTDRTRLRDPNIT